MNKHPTKDIYILRDDIPFSHIGVPLSDRFGTGHGFTFDKAHPTHLYYQSQIFLQILDAQSKKILFEYRILAMLKCDKRINDEGFYELIYPFILSTIDEFNGELKLKKSTLTAYKTYAPIPTIKEMKDPIRKAYTVNDFNIPLTSN